MKEEIKNTIDYLKQPKISWAIILIIFLGIIFITSNIRVSNVPLLVDATSGKAIPTALDPFYFLRLAETIMDNGGLPAFDAVRYPTLHAGFSPEILPYAIVGLYHVANMFGEYSLGYIDVISPVVFYVIGLILFFILTYLLTKSKWIALISSALLSVIPSYLYRTMAGFADHEAIGMVGFFAALISFVFLLKSLDKEDGWKKIIPLSLVVAFLTTFSIACWGGVANFLFLIIPLSFMVFWFISYKEPKSSQVRTLTAYVIWFVFTALFGLAFNYPPLDIIRRFMLTSTGLFSSGVLGYLVVDFIVSKFKKEKRLFYSIITTIIVGSIGLLLIHRNPLTIILDIWFKLLFPFGLGRVGLTVAENAQPYLVNWISQIGEPFFWFFFGGAFLIGIALSKSVEKIKDKRLFIFFWIFMLAGILFSRISPVSAFNGSNLLSKLFYLSGLLAFTIFSIKVYLKDGLKRIEPELIILAVWLFSTIIAGRAAIRIFFVITPFFCFSVGYFIVKLIEYCKTNKEETIRFFLITGVVITLILVSISAYTFFVTVNTQAKYTGLSANPQWQGAMEWTRDNTPEGSLFVHWWDYGYWVQYLGERPTVTDGGHFCGYWDYIIGRYVLTTPNPATALSYMKTLNVSYLLVDPTDIGKYPAYSSIGSDNNNDRTSGIIPMLTDVKQTTETSTGENRVYQGQYGVDEDIALNINGTEIFLPGPAYNEKGQPLFKAYVIGVVLTINNNGTLRQPTGVFMYQGQQYRLPLRYAYDNKILYDFGNGIESGIRMIPKIDQTPAAGTSIDEMGALIYLSKRTFNSLIGQLYLMDDPQGIYPGVELAHAEDNFVVEALKSYYPNLDDFVYYQGIQGPIKIWEINIQDDIEVRPEFLKTSGGWGEFDSLEFRE